MTTGTAVYPVASRREARFVQALWVLVVVAGLGTAAFISTVNSNRSPDDVFVASNGGIARVSVDGTARVDWIVNDKNPLTRAALHADNNPWRVTRVEQEGATGWRATTEANPLFIRSPEDSWSPPSSDFRPVTFGIHVALLAGGLMVLSLYHPDVRIIGGGLFLGLLGFLFVLTGAIPVQFAIAVPAAFALLAVQYLRAVPNPPIAFAAAVGAAVLAFMPFLVWKYTTVTALRNIFVMQMFVIGILVTGARLATTDR